MEEVRRGVRNSDDWEMVVVEGRRDIELRKGDVRDEVRGEERVERIVWVWEIWVWVWRIVYV